MEHLPENEWQQIYGCDVDEVDLDSILDFNQPLLPNVLDELVPAERVYSSQLRFAPLNSIKTDTTDGTDSDSGLGTSVDSDILSGSGFVVPPQSNWKLSVANDDEDIFADIMQTQTQQFQFTLPSETPRFDFPCSQQSLRLSQTQINNSLTDDFTDFSQASDQIVGLNNSSFDDLISYPIPKRIQRYSIPKRGQNFNQFPLTTAVMPSLPVSIKCLYEGIRSTFSDYAFAHAISAQMCQDILPMDAYVTLKQSLLLSIISVQNHNNSNITPMSIVAVGTDSSSVALIMNRIGSYAQRFVCPMEVKNNPVNNPEFIEPGPLQLAQNGICYIGEWLRLKPACSYFIRKVLDSGVLPAANSNNLTTSLNCSIWIHWTCCLKNIKKTINDVATFLHIFGIPIILEDNGADSITDFILDQAIKGRPADVEDELNISQTDMLSFLRFAGNLTTEMSSEAEDLLNKYFVATRSDRPDALAPRGLVMLRQLSESHAKLCLRSCVLRQDAIAAISISEKFIRGFFGCNYMIAPKQEPVTHIEQVDSYMSTFEDWLMKYIDSGTNNSFMGID